MQRALIILATVFVVACSDSGGAGPTVDPTSFEGNWFSIRPQGVTTFHSDSTFLANGEVVVRFFTCLSSTVESEWTDHGQWSYDGSALTITLPSNEVDDDIQDTFTRRYLLMRDDFDRREFESDSGDYAFWLQRRWAAEPYTCATTRADIDTDREAALNDGRFKATYPLYIENDT